VLPCKNFSFVIVVLPNKMGENSTKAQFCLLFFFKNGRGGGHLHPLPRLLSSCTRQDYWTYQIHRSSYYMVYIKGSLCKFLLGVHKNSTNFAVQSELGRFPLHLDILKQILRFWQRLENLDSSFPLLKAAYKCTKN
jgi:hypothetical protein